MEKKRIKELVLAGVIIAALVVLVWWMMSAKEQEEQQVRNETRTLPTTATQAPTTINPEEVPKVQEVSAGTVARTFVERVGSYSSESNYKNVDDVLGVVTSKLGEQLEKDAEKARAQEPGGGGYYGISTRYIGAKTEEASETRVTLLVQTQREESFGSPGNASVRYQEIEVILVQEAGVWKVDAYTWKE